LANEIFLDRACEILENLKRIHATLSQRYSAVTLHQVVLQQVRIHE
jgi:hypothetical protein